MTTEIKKIGVILTQSAIILIELSKFKKPVNLSEIAVEANTYSTSASNAIHKLEKFGWAKFKYKYDKLNRPTQSQISITNKGAYLAKIIKRLVEAIENENKA